MIKEPETLETSRRGLKEASSVFLVMVGLVLTGLTWWGAYLLWSDYKDLPNRVTHLESREEKVLVGRGECSAWVYPSTLEEMNAMGLEAWMEACQGTDND